MGTETPHLAVIETESPLLETLNACIDIAERISAGQPARYDEATLVCHLRVLRDDLNLTMEKVDHRG